MKALITAGGRGTRLRPMTYTMNKHLIPLANKPMIVHAIEKIAETGIAEIGININEGDTTIEEICGDGSRWGVSITYLEQEGGALGLAHIIKNAQEWLGDSSFVFYLGDNIVLGSIKKFVDAFAVSGASGYLALSKVPDPQRFGVPEIDADGNIVRVIEKPENPPSEFAVTGIYCYDKHVHEAVNNIQPSARGEYEISDVHTYLIENNHDVKYEVVEGWWKDTGKPVDLLEGNNLLLDHIVEKNEAAQMDSRVQIEGTVHMEEGVKLLGSTRIIGPVAIGRDTTIRDSVIGPHVSVGSATEIEAAHIERSIVMDEVDIRFDQSRIKKIVDSSIGHNVSIHHTESEHSSMIVGENTFIDL